MCEEVQPIETLNPAKTQPEGAADVTAPVDATPDAGAPDAPVAAEQNTGCLGLIVAVLLVWILETAITWGVLIAAGASVTSVQEGLTPGRILLISLLSAPVSFAIAWYFVCGRFGKSFRDGFVLKGVEQRALKRWALFSIFAAFVVTAALAWHGQEEGFFMADLLEQPGGLLVIIVLALLLPPFEECYYRGLIQPALARKFGYFAVPLTAAWFASAHLFQLWGNWLGIGVIIVMGLIWSVQRHYAKSLLPSLVSHWTYNATLVLITIAQVVLDK